MAKTRTTTARDVFKRIRDEDICFLDVKFVDLLGTLQHITLPVEAIEEDLFQKGPGFDGSSVRGFQKIHESDMKLLPDAGTLFRDPFFDDPTLSVFCDIVDPSGYKPYSRDPRGVARRAQRLTRSLGIADEVFLDLSSSSSYLTTFATIRQPSIVTISSIPRRPSGIRVRRGVQIWPIAPGAKAPTLRQRPWMLFKT